MTAFDHEWGQDVHGTTLCVWCHVPRTDPTAAVGCNLKMQIIVLESVIARVLRTCRTSTDRRCGICGAHASMRHHPDYWCGWLEHALGAPLLAERLPSP